MKGVMDMKQYFIGVNQRSENVIRGLFDLGATLMFYYHPKTIELNNNYGFYDGEWMFYTCFDDSEIEKIRAFLESKSDSQNLKFEIISA